MAQYFKVIDKNRTDGRVDIVEASELYETIDGIVGDKKAPCGMPYSVEVDGWGELCTWGETYETEDFVVVCLTDEEYEEYLK